MHSPIALLSVSSLSRILSVLLLAVAAVTAPSLLSAPLPASLPVLLTRFAWVRYPRQTAILLALTVGSPLAKTVHLRWLLRICLCSAPSQDLLCFTHLTLCPLRGQWNWLLTLKESASSVPAVPMFLSFTTMMSHLPLARQRWANFPMNFFLLVIKQFYLERKQSLRQSIHFKYVFPVKGWPRHSVKLKEGLKDKSNIYI